MGIGMIRRARRLSAERKERLEKEQADRVAAESKTEVVAPKVSPTQAAAPKPEAPRRHGR